MMGNKTEDRYISTLSILVNCRRGMLRDDGAGLHFIDQKLVRAVSSRPHAKVYEVKMENGSIQEIELETIYLRR
jgi:hypothetical protein